MRSSNQFAAKVNQIRDLIAQGDAQAATEVLDQAWNLAGADKSFRTEAHALGNEIQRVIFAQYEAMEGAVQ